MRRVIALLPLALLAGCGTFADPSGWLSSDSVDPPAELVEINNQIDVQTQWSHSIGSGADGLRLNLRPRLANGVLYAANAGGRVEAMNATNGSALWQVDLNARLAGGPGVGDDLVAVGTRDAEVIVLDINSGAERWRSRVSSEVLATPAIAYGLVIVHTIDGKILGLDAANGKERWRYEREVPVLSLRGSASPMVREGLVFCGLAGGRVVALQSSDGTPVWDTTVKVPSGRSELERLADIDGDPLLIGGGVFVATFQGEVAGLGEDNGQVYWRRKLSAHSQIASDRRQLFVSDTDGFVWALDPTNGGSRWKQEALKNRRLSNAVVMEKYIVVGDFEGYLHWLSIADGSLVARTKVGSGPITNGLLSAEGVLYVQGDDGSLAALRLPESR